MDEFEDYELRDDSLSFDKYQVQEVSGMGEFFYAFEVVTPKGKIENVWVPDLTSPQEAKLGFDRLIDDGFKVTGVFSGPHERVDGQIIRNTEPRGRVAAFVDGFRTRAPWLRA